MINPNPKRSNFICAIKIISKPLSGHDLSASKKNYNSIFYSFNMNYSEITRGALLYGLQSERIPIETLLGNLLLLTP